jgi:hypothetical protein
MKELARWKAIQATEEHLFWDNAEYMEHWPSQISLVAAAVRGSKGRGINMKEPYRD